MLDLRVLRATVLPVLLALIVVAFSLENRPEPLRTSFSPDAFQAQRVVDDVAAFAATFRDRRPGGPGDGELAEAVRVRLERLLPGVRVQQRIVPARTIDGDRDLVTVLAQQPGTMPGGQLVLVAQRDAATAGGGGDLSATAGLLELARVLSSSRLKRSVTFASVSGGTGGQGGMRDLLARLQRPVDALIEVGDIGGPAVRSPALVGWSNGRGAAPQRLLRTLALALREEARTDGGAPQVRAQLARFAFPVSLSGQGVALAAGIPAVRLSMSGESPASVRTGVVSERAGRIGQALLRAITALDAGPDIPHGASSDLIVGHKLIPGWAVRLLVGVLLVAPLLVVGDALARRRRRGTPIWPSIVHVLALTAPVVLALLFIRGVALLGLVDVTGPPAPPGAVPFGARGALALVCGLVAVALGVVLVRPGFARRRRTRTPDLEAELTLAPVAAITICAAVWWVVNPYAAAVLVPATYLWLILPGRTVHPRRGPALAAVLLSALPAAVLLQSSASQLGVSATRVPWFAFLTLAGGQGGLVAALLWSLVAGAGIGALAMAWRAGSHDTPRTVTVRGPVSYAGPGSLGGTASSRRR